MAFHRTHDWIRAFAFATRNVEVMLAVAGLLGTSVPNFRFLFQRTGLDFSLTRKLKPSSGHRIRP